MKHNMLVCHNRYIRLDNSHSRTYPYISRRRMLYILYHTIQYMCGHNHCHSLLYIQLRSWNMFEKFVPYIQKHIVLYNQSMSW